jgi:PAS domain S-box-containing protein
LAGRGSLLKSYSIATEALGRSADFDPATDAIVRVEAKRLRQVLTSIYDDPDCKLQIRIDIPVGRYEPSFRRFISIASKQTEADKLHTGVFDPEKLSKSIDEAGRMIRSEERYRALVQASAAVEWRADAMGRVTGSIGWTERTGQDAEELKDNGWLQALHPDDREKTIHIWRHGCLTGEKMEASYRVRHRDGSYRWMFARGIPIESPDENIQEWVGTVTDVHDHMEAVEALRIGEQKLRLILEAARLVTWELDPATEHVTRSSNSHAVFGIGSGPASEFYNLIHPDDRARVTWALNEAIRNNRSYEEGFWILKADGQLVYFLARGRLALTEPSEGTRFIGIAWEAASPHAAWLNGAGGAGPLDSSG